MSENKKQGYIKTESTILIAFITLTIGFIGGTAFGIYKSDPTHVPQPSGMPPSAKSSADQAAQIETLKQLTLKKPDDAKTWIQLGHLYFDTGQYQEAIIAYEKSLEVAPGDADIITDLGVMYRRSGKPEKAIAKFDEAIGINPSHQIARFNKGVVLMHDLNDTKGAIDTWQELVELNPEAKTPNGQLVRDFITQFEKQNAQ